MRIEIQVFVAFNRIDFSTSTVYKNDNSPKICGSKLGPGSHLHMPHAVDSDNMKFMNELERTKIINQGSFYQIVKIHLFFQLV